MKKPMGKEFMLIGRDHYAFHVIEKEGKLKILWQGYRTSGLGVPEWFAERHKIPISRDQALWRRLRGLPPDATDNVSSLRS
jgi:hypothetical protein